MKSIVKIQISLTLVLAVLVACSENFDVIPVSRNESTWQRTLSIAEVREFYLAGADKYDQPNSLVEGANARGFWATLAGRGVVDSLLVVEGVIVSSDSAGNFYKTVTIMDDSGPGIDISVSDKNTYRVYGFKPGQRVRVKLNGLFINNYHGMYQLGIPADDYTSSGHVVDLQGIPVEHVESLVQRDGKRGQPIPEDVTLDKIDLQHVQRLVRIHGVQFVHNREGFTNGDGSTGNRALIDSALNTILVRTNGYASFGTTPMPQGSGTVTGVVSIYNGTFQLLLRDPSDAHFTEPVFEQGKPEPNYTVAQLSEKMSLPVARVMSPWVIKATVIANDMGNNIYKTLYLADSTGGIPVKVNATSLYAQYPVGTQLILNCEGLFRGAYGGVVQLGGKYEGKIGQMSEADWLARVYVVDAPLLDVQPQTVTLSDLKPEMLNTLVRLENVYFKDAGKPFVDSGKNTSRTLMDAKGKSIVVYTSQYADFASEVLPSGNGTVVGVYSEYNGTAQLLVRTLSDIEFSE